MYCPICKSENKQENIFCTECGIKIGDFEFVNKINSRNIESQTSRNSSKSIQIINTVVHGGVSLEGTAYGRNEGVQQNTRRHGSICPDCGNIVQLRDKICPECKAILRS